MTDKGADFPQNVFYSLSLSLFIYYIFIMNFLSGRTLAENLGKILNLGTLSLRINRLKSSC